MTWYMARNTENTLKSVENEKCSLQNLEYGKKKKKKKNSEKRGMSNAHCRTWNMARKLKNVEKKETNTA
jgi:hypothetical protein